MARRKKDAAPPTAPPPASLHSRWRLLLLALVGAAFLVAVQWPGKEDAGTALDTGVVERVAPLQASGDKVFLTVKMPDGAIVRILLDPWEASRFKPGETAALERPRNQFLDRRLHRPWGDGFYRSYLWLKWKTFG